MTRGRRAPWTVALVAAGISLGHGGAAAQAQGAARLAVQPARPSAGPSASDRAVSLINDGQFAEARAVLQEAVRAQPTPWRLYNLGITLRALGAYREAMEALTRYAERPEPNADARRLAAVRDEIARLRGSLAALRLRVSPGTAEVRVDGREAPRDGYELRVNPGARVVQVAAPGYVPEWREVELAPGETQELSVELRPSSRALPVLGVRSQVPDASISVDGRALGAGSVERTIEPGEHEVELRSPGYEPMRRRVTVGPEGATRVEAALARTPRGVLALVLVGVGALVVGAAVGAAVAVAAQ